MFQPLEPTTTPRPPANSIIEFENKGNLGKEKVKSPIIGKELKITL